MLFGASPKGKRGFHGDPNERSCEACWFAVFMSLPPFMMDNQPAQFPASHPRRRIRLARGAYLRTCEPEPGADSLP